MQCEMHHILHLVQMFTLNIFANCNYCVETEDKWKLIQNVIYVIVVRWCKV